jgi:hypothetical protein
MFQRRRLLSRMERSESNHARCVTSIDASMDRALPPPSRETLFPALFHPGCHTRSLFSSLLAPSFGPPFCYSRIMPLSFFLPSELLCCDFVCVWCDVKTNLVRERVLLILVFKDGTCSLFSPLFSPPLSFAKHIQAIGLSWTARPTR